MITIRFLPENRQISVEENITILEAIQAAGIHILASCGGEQLCGECKVRVITNTPPYVDIEESFLSDAELSASWRLACIHNVQNEMQIVIPHERRIEIEKVFDSTISTNISLKPIIQKTVVKITPEFMESESALDSAFNSLLGGNDSTRSMSLAVYRQAARILKNTSQTTTIVYTPKEILAIEDGDTSRNMYGVALDIGTTTIAGLLIDLCTGDTVGIETRVNSQISYGADVMSRINFALLNDEGTNTLSASVRETVNEILDALIKKAEIDKEFIYLSVVVGNPAMMHLFQNIYPGQLAFSPYLPISCLSQTVSAEGLDLNINQLGIVYIFPVLSGFVGGDMVGVILSSEMDRSNKINLAIDLGTNGEIVVGSSERLIAAATAAGPAFEGSKITCGMPATMGAINTIRLNDSGCEYNTIGGVEPQGLCGSGIIDIIAELLRHGIIDATGRFVSGEKLNKKIPDYLIDRIILEDKKYSFLIWEGDGRKIILTQQDVREFQLAKGAIKAGIAVLMKIMDYTDSQLNKLFIAGTFGTYIRKKNVQRIGMLPEVHLSKINIIGNAACLGAKRALIDESEQMRAELIASHVEHINLAAREDFQEEFMTALAFPRQENI